MPVRRTASPRLSSTVTTDAPSAAALLRKSFCAACSATSTSLAAARPVTSPMRAYAPGPGASSTISTFSAAGLSSTWEGKSLAHANKQSAKADAMRAPLCIVQGSIVPEKKLDRPRPAIEDVIVRTGINAEVMGNAGILPRLRDFRDRIVEIVVVARQEAKFEAGMTRARGLRRRHPHRGVLG